MDTGIEIKGIQKIEVIPYLHWIKDIPKRKQVESEPIESIIVNMLQGKYNGLLGLSDDKPCALVIYQMITNRHLSIKLMLAKGHMVRFYMALMQYLNQFRIESFEFESGHKPKLWDRIFSDNISVIRTSYMFDVKSLFTVKGDDDAVQ